MGGIVFIAETLWRLAGQVLVVEIVSRLLERELQSSLSFFFDNFASVVLWA